MHLPQTVVKTYAACTRQARCKFEWKEEILKRKKSPHKSTQFSVWILGALPRMHPDLHLPSKLPPPLPPPVSSSPATQTFDVTLVDLVVATDLWSVELVRFLPIDQHQNSQ